MSEKLTKNIFRIIFLFIIFLLSIFFNSNEIFATEGDTIATGTSGDCTYTITELVDGTYSVNISGEGAMTDYSSYSSSPFYTYRSYISEVYVENGVTTIGTYSFAARSSSYLYSYLTLVDCSNCTTLTSIGNYAFYYCSGLTSVNLSGCTSLTSIGNYAFYYCSSLTELELSGCTSLTSIGNYAFYYCSSLTNIDFLDDCKSTLTTINVYAFGYCTSLTEVDLSDYIALTYLSGFYYCSNLTSVNLNGCTSLATIGDYAFHCCSSLTELDLNGCTSLATIGNFAFYRCSSLTELDLNSCKPILTNIGDYVFYNCSSLTKIDLSGCIILKSIGYGTFAYCTSLVSVDLSDCLLLEYLSGGYKSFSTSARGLFTCSDNLQTVSLSNCKSLSYIGLYAFGECTSLETIDLTGCVSLKGINYRAFYNCTSLASIDLSDCINLVAIWDFAFYNCYELTNINLNNCSQLTNIGEYAFYYCYSLESIDLSDCTLLGKIEKDTFAYCTNLEEVILPISIFNIESEAFYYCVKLESINLENCTLLTSIEQYVFYYCENLKNIEFPASLYQIHNYAFYCTAIEEIDLSSCSNLSYIGTYAFFRWYDDYDENVNIYLPKNTTIEIGYAGLYQNRIDLGWWGTWSGYYYVDDSGVAYYYTTSDDENYAYLLFVPNGISSMEIPSSITVDEGEYDVIGVGCFSLQYASDLETITFEDSSKITYLEAYSFAYCENLTTVQGYNTSDEIMENVFYNVSTDYEYTLFECTNIDTTYNLIVYFTFDYYEYFTYETEIDDISEITLELYCDGEVIEEVIQYNNGMSGTVYTFKDLEMGHEYYVDVKHNLDGWGANIRYYYSGDSTLTYEWIDIARIYAYTVDIDWNDEESTGERPSEVEVILYDEDGNEYATGILNEENNWSYTFYVNTFSSSYTINYSYETIEYTTAVIAEDSIIEADIVSYDVSYDEEIQLVASATLSYCSGRTRL